jgi:hypothetical protein
LKKEESVLYHEVLSSEEQYLATQKNVKVLQRELRALPQPDTASMDFLSLSKQARLSTPLKTASPGSKKSKQEEETVL